MIGAIAAHYVDGGGGGGFKPTDIPDLLAWYSAAAETGYADGAQMSTLLDHSGNGNHGTSASSVNTTWQATTGSGGGPAIRFNSGRFNLPNLMAGVTSAEVMASVKSDGNVDGGLWTFSTAGGNQHYAFSDGKVYENWGSSARPGYTPTVSVASWRRYNVWTAANDWTVRLDETNQVTSASNTVTFVTTPSLGGASYPFQGHVGGVVIYGRKLTTTERADLAAWLTANPSGGTP